MKTYKCKNAEYYLDENNIVTDFKVDGVTREIPEIGKKMPLENLIQAGFKEEIDNIN